MWNQYLSWWSDAWMLAGNGTYSETDVADMSIKEINEAMEDADFEVVFYTEADENGDC